MRIVAGLPPRDFLAAPNSWRCGKRAKTGVAQCAVIGIPHEKWGERVHAVIVSKDGRELDTEALVAFCRTHIAGYKVPRSYEFVDSLPLSGAGKVLKRDLRERHRR